MPTQLNVYKCNVCGGIFDHTITVNNTQISPEQQAQNCENSHPGTMTFARAAQGYHSYKPMPDSIFITHNGVEYKYCLE